MPVITSAVIDVVVARGPLERLILLGIAALIVLGQNFPTQILVTSQPNRQQSPQLNSSIFGSESALRVFKCGQNVGRNHNESNRIGTEMLVRTAF